MRQSEHVQLQSKDDSIDTQNVEMDAEKSDSIKSYVSLKSKEFYKFIAFQVLWISPWIAGTIVIPLFGAQWFGGCIDQYKLNVTIIAGCEPDYVTYNFFFTLFGSIGGLFSFLFASFMGRLSDSFGRKVFIILGIIFWMIPRVTLIFYINFYLYWCLGLLSDINGGDQILPSLKASISDIVSPKDRLNAFGRMHGSMGTGLIIGAGCAVMISTIWDNYTVLIATSVWYTILLIFTTFCIHETIDINHNRVSITNKVWNNPFRPLTVVCYNKFVMIMSFISFFGALIEAGIMSSLFGYVGHSLQIVDDGKASMVFGIYVAIVSLVLVPVSIFFLPFLKRKKVHYSNIITIAVCFRILSLFLLALISFDLNGVSEYVLYASAVLHGAGLFNFAVLEGIMSEYIAKDCQGVAFGVVTSYKGIAGVVGPFSFGLLFTELSDTNFSFLFIAVGIFFCFVEIILSLFPLKKLINAIEPQSVEIKVRGEEIDRMQTIPEDDVELSNVITPNIDKQKLVISPDGDTNKPLVMVLDDDDDDDNDDEEVSD